MPELETGTAGFAILRSLAPYLVAGFFSAATVLGLILLHLFGTRIFMHYKDKGRTGPIVFGIGALFLGLFGIVASILVNHLSASILIGLVSGFFIWTAIGEVGQEMGWVSVMDRSAVPLFLAAFAIWLSGFLVDLLPPAVMAALGYPACVWGMNLTRVRVLSKWGPASLHSTILGLTTAAVAGGGLVLGMVDATPVSGIVGGVIFAMATWSVLEILWERGTARKPWRR